jgi:hypothetical protein
MSIFACDVAVLGGQDRYGTDRAIQLHAASIYNGGQAI